MTWSRSFRTTAALTLAAILTSGVAAKSAPAAVCGEWNVGSTPEVPVGDFGSVQFRDVAAIAPDDVWTVGYIKAGSPTWATLTLAEHWDGTEWTVIPTPNPSATINDLMAVAARATDDVWAVGTKEVGTPFRTLRPLVIHWDGSSWQEITDSALERDNSTFDGIEIVSENEIWFGGDGIRAARWNGSTFVITSMPVFETGSCSGTYGCGHSTEDFAAIASDDVWAVGGAGDGDYSYVSQIFHWDGSAWAHVPGPSISYDQRLYGVAALATDDVWAVGDITAADPTDPGLLIVHWDGSGWTRVATPLFTHVRGALHDIVALAPNDIWAAGIYTETPPPALPKPLTMHFDGTDWVEVTPDPLGPDSAWLRGISAAGPCDLWAVGSTYGPPHVQHLLPTVSTSTPFEFVTPGTLRLAGAPNPFRESTTIRFDLPSQGSARVAIYDVRGQRVRTLVDGVLAAGPQARDWSGLDDAGQPVSPGVYFVRLETGAGTETRKLQLVR